MSAAELALSRAYVSKDSNEQTVEIIHMCVLVSSLLPACLRRAQNLLCTLSHKLLVYTSH